MSMDKLYSIKSFIVKTVFHLVQMFSIPLGKLNRQQ